MERLLPIYSGIYGKVECEVDQPLQGQNIETAVINDEDRAVQIQISQLLGSLL